MTQQGVTQTIDRYRKQSVRLLDSAFSEMRKGRWNQSEELVWGSLTLAVKAVALTRGRTLGGPQGGPGLRPRVGPGAPGPPDTRGFQATVLLLRPDRPECGRSRSRIDYLFIALDDVGEAVEHLWQMVPREGETSWEDDDAQ